MDEDEQTPLIGTRTQGPTQKPVAKDEPDPEQPKPAEVTVPIVTHTSRGTKTVSRTGRTQQPRLAAPYKNRLLRSVKPKK